MDALLGLSPIRKNRIDFAWRKNRTVLMHGNRMVISAVLNNLAVVGIQVTFQGRELSQIDDLSDTYAAMSYANLGASRFGYAITYLLRWKMFEPDLEGVLNLDNLVLDEAAAVRRPAVGNAFLVNASPYLPLDARPVSEIEVDLNRAILQNRSIVGPMMNIKRHTNTEIQSIVRNNETIARFALMLGMDHGYAHALEFMGTAYHELALRQRSAGDEGAAIQFFAMARAARLKAARVCYLLSEERPDDLSSFIWSAARHLLFVGMLDIESGDFDAGINLKLELLKELGCLYDKTKDPLYLEISLKGLIGLADDYYEAGKFLEMGKVKRTRARVLFELGRLFEAAEEYYYSAARLREHIVGEASDEALEIQKDCLLRAIRLYKTLELESRLNIARKRLQVVVGQLDKRFTTPFIPV